MNGVSLSIADREALASFFFKLNIACTEKPLYKSFHSVSTRFDSLARSFKLPPSRCSCLALSDQDTFPLKALQQARTVAQG